MTTTVDSVNAQTPTTSTPVTATTKRGAVQVSEAANIVNVLMIIASIALVSLVLTDTTGNIRIALTVAVFLFGPGSGIVQFLRLEKAAMQLGLLIGFSAAIDILLGQALLSVHNISSDAAACLLAGITCLRPVRIRSNEKAS